jgi:hypothetical protein
MNPRSHEIGGRRRRKTIRTVGNSESKVGLGNPYALYFGAYNTLQSDQLHERHLRLRRRIHRTAPILEPPEGKQQTRHSGQRTVNSGGRPGARSQDAELSL